MNGGGTSGMEPASFPAPIRLVLIGEGPFQKDLIFALGECARAELAGIARGSEQGLLRAAKAMPDIVALDMEMPDGEGRETLERLRLRLPGICVILVATPEIFARLRREGVLENGATAFLARGGAPGSAAGRKEIAERLPGLLERYAAKRAAVPEKGNPGAGRSRLGCGPIIRPEAVAIGASTGGPHALEQVLSGLPGDLPAPVLIVQHMREGMTHVLAGLLNGKAGLPVSEGRDGEAVEKGRVYLAPGGWQMKVIRDDDGRVRIALRDDPPENFCKPSADYLFRSVAEAYAGRALGVILTGIGNDGADGLRSLKLRGGRSIGQDEPTSVVYGMPKAAKEAGAVDIELPLGKISAEIRAALGL